jgi:hypothetical protein
MDKDKLICFIGEQPCQLRVTFDIPVSSMAAIPTEMRHYPTDSSGYLVRGLQGKKDVLIPASNFAPDGRSYLVYSSKRHAIVQKDLNGRELASAQLPAEVKWEEFAPRQPAFSRDGRHIAFVGKVAGPPGNKKAIYVADVK